MKKLIVGSIACASLLFASENFEDIFKEGKAFGDIKYYYIQTDKQNDIAYKDTSANAHAIGGQLGFKTSTFYGFNAQATFMTTNGFFLDDSVDTSILGRDNGIRLQGSASGDIAQDSFSVLGEAFLKYSFGDFDINYGRQVMKSPLINAKVVRMLPSAVQGSVMHYGLKEYGLDMEVSYLTDFKQRTSNKFINILEHALGVNTKVIIGDDSGEVIVAKGSWKQDDLSLSFYDYYSQNFLNSLYANATYKGSLNDYTYDVGIEGIVQRSIGNADRNLAKSGSLSNGKKINVEALSFKGDLKYGESKFMVGYSYIASDNSVHDSLVLPWDGTPLYTNMITSNDLFVSNYGKGLNADSIYIGGTQSFKIGYTQTYDFTGTKGFKTALSYMIADNDKFRKGKQKDFNVVLGYKYDEHFSIALKGIFVKNNTSAQADGSISQLDDFQQYRVIANYKF